MIFNEYIHQLYYEMAFFYLLSFLLDKDERIRDIILPFVFYIQKSFQKEFLDNIYLLYALADDH